MKNRTTITLTFFVMIVMTTMVLYGTSQNIKSNFHSTDHNGNLTDHGVILAQYLNKDNMGFTVIRLWGSYYEMGYAQAELLGEYIVDGVNDIKSYLEPEQYSTLRTILSEVIWAPQDIEDELSGMVDGLKVHFPSAEIDILDLKVINTIGDWLNIFSCRSHSCWGRYVSDPVKTLSTRRLDYPDLSLRITAQHHHVLYVRQPNDQSPKWVCLSNPGIILSSTNVNQYGTLVSIHDFHSQDTDISAGVMPRMVAIRYVTTYANSTNMTTHLQTIYDEIKNYDIMTGGFLNYYAPNGYGGVLSYNPAPPSIYNTDFFDCRLPQEVWHHGEAMITTNAWTNGTYTPSDENFGADQFYNDETPKSLEEHWTLLDKYDTGTLNQHILSVAYRDIFDMTIWVEGKISAKERTPRLEWEWYDLFNGPTVPEIIGPDKGEKKNVYNYSICSIDVQRHEIYYIIDWGDESKEETIGPLPSGEEQTVTHIWNESGSYVVRVKARNEINAESDWSNPLVVTMPKSKHYNHFNFLFEKLIYRFPLFEKILNQILL